MLTNADLAELLCRASAEQEARSNKQRALERSGRAALWWTEEAASLAGSGRTLTELDTVGPWVASVIEALLAAGEPPDPELTPPERRGFSSRSAARAVLDAQPQWRSLLRGDLQTHTTSSDGADTLTDMALQAAALGHDYLAVTDHTKGLRIAGGMDESRLALQSAEVVAVNADLQERGLATRVLHGVEMNLDPLGAGDMEPDALRPLDIVLGAFHSQLRLRDDQTARYLAALDNPDIDVLAHPRTRMFGRRRGLDADWDRVMARARERDVAIEVDASPYRQDIDGELLQLAASLGVRIAVSSDAHSVGELAVIEVGLAACATAGVDPQRIVNAMSADGLLAWRRRPRDA